MVHKPSGLLSMISDGQHTHLGISRQILTTRRCYCILSRLPFFDLHFGVLNRFVSLSIEFSSLSRRLLLFLKFRDSSQVIAVVALLLVPTEVLLFLPFLAFSLKKDWSG